MCGYSIIHPRPKMDKAVIQTEGLTKYYGKKLGISEVNIRIRAGEVFGYLGPNGAGKTTTIRILMDFIRADRGQALIFGLDSTQSAPAIHRRVGYLPGDLTLYENMTVKEMFEFFTRLRNGVDQIWIEKLADRFQCDLSHPIRTLSQGNKQKVGIIQAFMHRPELLILDEPTRGLDPLVRGEFYNLVRESRKEGCTVFLSSHVLPEVERVCDRVGIIRSGRIVAVEDVDELKKRSVRQVEVEFVRPVARDALASIDGLEIINMTENRAICRITGTMDPLIKRLGRYEILDISSQNPGLEEIFLTYYGEGKKG